MLGQRMEPVLTSQTLPKLDGQDEDGDNLVEAQFEMLCATNSCPDLSVLEEEQSGLLDDSKVTDFNTIIRRGSHLTTKTEDQVDGIYIKHNQGSSSGIGSGGGVPSKIPLGFRRRLDLELM